MLNDFRDHLDSWRHDDYFARGVAPGRLRTAVLALQLVWLRIGTHAICALRGHRLIDDDPGDPEVGPCPNVYCTRCGASW